MNVRLISGIYGGRKIDAPDNARTHPMSERVRGALFNIIRDECRDARVLDAFAGTGSLGFEALSNGAREVTFIERDRLAAKILKKNAQTLGCADHITLIDANVSVWSKNNQNELFDLVFVDPPYHDMQLSTVSKLFYHLKPGALMLLSHPGRGETLTELGIVVVDNRSYGNASLTFYRREV